MSPKRTAVMVFGKCRNCGRTEHETLVIGKDAPYSALFNCECGHDEMFTIERIEDVSVEVMAEARNDL